MSKRIREMLEQLGLKGEEADLGLRDLADAYLDQRLLISIGRALNVERDTDKLLKMILFVSKKITCADACSIFLLEDEGRRLRFKHSHTTSNDLDYEEFTLERDKHSIAGYVSITGEVLNIKDAYDLDPALPFGFNQSFDVLNGYRTKSMLVVPMKNHLDEMIGVIQLINSKESPSLPPGQDAFAILLKTRDDFEEKVFPFKARYNSLMVAVANQAAIAIENARMIKQIKEQFEAFVSASVMAVESRDPATSGHSHRVSLMAVALARAVNAAETGPYAPRRFSETELVELGYAGLLHDFGKVYIDPQVFLKAKKLYPRDYDCLVMRLNYLYRTVECGYAERRIESAASSDSDALARLNREKDAVLDELLGVSTLVSMLNEPKATVEDPREGIDRILKTPVPGFAQGLDGTPIPLLTESEIVNLSVARGSLNEDERKIIQSHVEHTYAFVSKIPWPPEFRRIPEYAYAHHEMMDGSGYPRGIKGDAIPAQSRILAVCDIFDALIASDRPYKKALRAERALEILREEGERGKLDPDLVALFIEGRAWEAAAPEGAEKAVE
jgi:HD-GYP domain-containing protein (c-di-GMP phosphodiesterase class II)